MSEPATLYALLARNVTQQPARTAIIDPDAAFDYRTLGRRVDAMATRLLRLGVQPGDRVVVQLRKSIAEVAAMFAVAKVGGVIVNVNAQWTPAQLCHVAQDCTPGVLIVEAAMARLLAGTALPASVTSVMTTTAEPIGADGAGGLDGAGGMAVARRAEDLALILYTSGSTGRPKGVMLSNRNVLAGAASVVRYLGLGEDDRLLSVLPYSFDYGLNQLTTMLMVGGTVVHQPVMMATELVRTMQRHQVTGVAAVPPLWSQIVRLLDRQPVPLPALRRITNSGGSIPRNILERLPHCFPGVDIYLMYGLTEAFRSTYLAPDRFALKMGAIGRAVPDADIHVIRHGEGIAGPGEQGELVHRGPLVSLGYWNQPEATRAKIRPCPELRHLIGDEPVVYSGDIVRIDDDGDLWFVGRNDAMVKTSGFRVSPDEIEDLVCRSGLVGDVVAFGVADDDLGQVVHVAVTPLADFDEATLLLACRRTMPPYMLPRRIHLWTHAMPRTASGKLARPDVVAACMARIAAPQDGVPPLPHPPLSEGPTPWR